MVMSNQNKDVYVKYLLSISDDDILEAMKKIEGYIDITLSDFKELYHITCNHAVERLMSCVRARDIMTKEVVSVKKDTLLKEIAEIMSDHNISGVPVEGDDGNVIGIISEKDFLFRMGSKETKSFMGIIAQCLNNKGCIAMPIREQKAEDIMVSPVLTVSEDTAVSEIMDIFTGKNVNRVPVLNKEMELAGIVSRADVLKASLPGIKA